MIGHHDDDSLFKSKRLVIGIPGVHVLMGIQSLFTLSSAGALGVLFLVGLVAVSFVLEGALSCELGLGLNS